MYAPRLLVADDLKSNRLTQILRTSQTVGLIQITEECWKSAPLAPACATHEQKAVFLMSGHRPRLRTGRARVPLVSSLAPPRGECGAPSRAHAQLGLRRHVRSN